MTMILARPRRLAAALAFLLPACATALAGPPAHQPEGHTGEDRRPADHSHHDHDPLPLPAPLGLLNPTEAWLDPWPHTHLSRRGTPLVHLFRTEPAYLGRDLLLDVTVLDGAEGTEVELEAELEWAFSRRIGLAVEAPLAWRNADEGSEAGIGDLGLAPRLLLAETDRLFLSLSVGLELPTGNEDRGLGAGEAVVAPSLLTWVDLGGGIALSASAGIEHGLETDSDTFVWGAGLTIPIDLSGRAGDAAEAGLRHVPAGLVSLIAEIRGELPLDGEEEGSGTGEVIFGASWSVSPRLEVRGGVVLPAWTPREFDAGAIFGVIVHF